MHAQNYCTSSTGLNMQVKRRSLSLPRLPGIHELYKIVGWHSLSKEQVCKDYPAVPACPEAPEDPEAPENPKDPVDYLYLPTVLRVPLTIKNDFYVHLIL